MGVDADDRQSQVPFAGMRVAVFESRRGEEAAAMIQTFGGIPYVSPAMREVPIAPNPCALDFAKQLMTGHIDLVIVLTGVGFQLLWDLLIRHVDADRLRISLADVVTIARGPKPVAAMKAVGLVPTHRIPEPNTWRELLQLVDQKLTVANWNVAIQEYGESNTGLVAGLEARGARVHLIPVYRWELPADLGPLQDNIRAICAGERDLLLFTASQQVTHVRQLARQMGLTVPFDSALPRAVIASIGPTTSESLQCAGFPVDLVPSHPKLATLIREAARQAPEILRKKRHESP